ncbi:SIR2 family protein [Acrocarpospora sp. B8E8]|uniref:SIR2 family NAD-dependent protein deacylase n=1 Tax=Acrocarpospora sp. B8E8 TaxID=3153572 RepID=UPI00325D1EA5
MDDADWERLINQLRRGDCTPLLGAGACAGTLPTGPDLSRKYASEYGYPFPDVTNLSRVMQWATSVVKDPVELKHLLCDHLQSFGVPDDAPSEPHMLLAEFPITTYLTTNYDDFLFRALTRAGRRPQAEIAKWWEAAPDETPLAEPTSAEPLVCHLHGSWSMPKSLVLTDFDYITYLINIVEAQSLGSRHPLPRAVVDAMTAKPLLFIGYSLQDWTFNVLFNGLARSVPRSNKRRHVVSNQKVL